MFEEDFGGANRNQVSTISAPIDTPVAQMTPVLKSEAPAEPEAPQAEIRSTDGFKAPDFNNYSDEDKARVKTQYGASWDKMSWWDRQRALAHDSWFQALDTGAIDEETLVDGIFKDPEIERINKSEVEFKSILRDAVTRDVSAMSDDEAQGYYMALVEADPHFRYKDDADGKMLFGEEAQYGRGNLSRLLGIYKGTNPQGLFSREAQKWFSLSEEQKKQVANDERTIKESVLGMFDDEGNIVASHEEKLMRQEKAVQFATLMGSMSPLGQEIVMKSIESGEIDAKTLNLLDDDERESALAAFRVNKAELDANWWLTQGAARAWETGESMIKGTWRQLANVYWTTGGRLPSGSKQLAAYEDNQLRQLQIEDAMRFKYKDNLTFAGDIAAGLMGSAPYMIAMANPYSGTLAVLGMSNDARERMILSGVDPDTALAVSIPVGVIEGWVEKIQWNKAFGKELTEYALRRTSLLAVAKQLAKGKSKYIGGKLLKAGKETAIVTLTEDCEEILQQITEDLGVQLGETITLGRNEFNVREILEDAWDTAVESFPTTLGFGLVRASGVGPSIHRRFSKNAVIGDEFQEYMQGKNAALNVIGQVNSENPAADIAQKAANPAPTAYAEEAGNEPSGAEKAQDGAKTAVYERLLDEMRVKWNRAKSAKARLEMLNDAGLNADQAAVVDEFFRLENDFVGENPVYDFYDPKTQTAYRNFDIMSLPSLMKGVKNVALNEDGTYTLDLQLDADTIVPVKVERVSRETIRKTYGSQLEREIAADYDDAHGAGSWANLDDDMRLLEIHRAVPGGFTNASIGDTTLPYKAIISLAAPDAASGDPGARNYEVGHEIFHAATLVAKQMGIVTGEDLAKMREVFGEPKIAGYDYDEEAAANRYGEWLVNRAKDPTGIFGKIRDLFRKIYNALFNKNGNEKPTNDAETIFDKIERGDLRGISASTGVKVNDTGAKEDPADAVRGSVVRVNGANVRIEQSKARPEDLSIVGDTDFDANLAKYPYLTAVSPTDGRPWVAGGGNVVFGADIVANARERNLGTIDINRIIAVDTLGKPIDKFLREFSPVEGMIAPQGKNKQPGVAYPDAAEEIVRYSIGKKAREDAIALILKKRWDIGSSYLSDEENDKLLKQFSEENPKGTFDDFRVWIKGKVAESIVDKIGEFKTPKEQKAALHWFIKGAIRLPEDAPKVTEAVQYGERAKGKANTDPMSYDSPMAMIDALHEFKPKAKPIDPDKCAEFTDRREMGNGVVTYLVQDDRAGQQKMREIINTHWGEDANPWCLLHGDGFGHLSDGTSGGYDAWYYWNHYSALPKRVAFKDGKLLAFMATDAKDDGIRQYEDYAEDIRAQGLPVPSISQWIQAGKYEGKINEQWWDRKDAPHDGIPLGNMPVPGDKFGRWADFEIRNGELKQIAGYRKGNRGESGYVEWYANGLKESQIVKADEEYYDWENNGDLYRAKVNGVQFNFQDGVLQSVYTKVDGEDIYINVDENLAPFDIEVGDEGNYSVGLDDDGNIAAYGESLELEKKLQSAYDKLKPHIAEAERIYRENSQTAVRFSVSRPIERVKDLVAAHNLKLGDIEGAIRLGGLPMPSIAIVKDSMGHDSYGEITILFKPSTIDPEANPLNKVYSGDNYTPTFPWIRREVEDNEGLTELTNWLSNRGVDTSFTYGFDRYETTEHFFIKSGGNSAKFLKYLDADAKVGDPIKFAWLKEFHPDKVVRWENNGTRFDGTENIGDSVALVDRNPELRIRYEQWFLDMVGNPIVREGIVRKDVKYFDENGDKRPFFDRHYPVTLDNIVKAMLEEKSRNPYSGSDNQAIIAAQKHYKSLQQIIDDEELLRMDENFYEKQKSANRRFAAFLSDLLESAFGEQFDGLADMEEGSREVRKIIDAAKGDSVEDIADAIQDIVDENGGEVDRDELNRLAGQLKDIIDFVRSIATGYFEAKPERAVRFDEFAAVLIPEINIMEPEFEARYEAVANYFDGLGIPVYEYNDDEDEETAGDIPDRLRKLNDAADDTMIRFSTGKGEENEEYRAVEAQYRDTDKWMKAPNGNPTNLTERQWVQVRTPAFKAWFGDWEIDPANSSKIVDENGEPRVVYHGTKNYGFTKFKTRKPPKHFNLPMQLDFGSHFSIDRDWVQDFYGIKYDESVYDTFLNIRNPKLIEDAFAKTSMKEIEKEGFDGVIYRPESRWTDATKKPAVEHREFYPLSFIAFDPTQIKSATDNTGAFDPTNPDIRYSVHLPITATAEELIGSMHGVQATRVDDSEILANGKTYTESFGVEKPYETRPTAHSIPLNTWVPIQSTHSANPGRNNKIVGFAWFDSVKEYTKANFHSPENQSEHLVPVGSKFDALDKKYGYHIARYIPIDPREPSVPASGFIKARYSVKLADSPELSMSESYIRFSVGYAPKNKAEVKAEAEKIAELTGEPLEKCINFVNSQTAISSVILKNREYLDYKADPNYSWMKTNSDYPQGTIDFDNLCIKRKLLTAAFTYLQGKHKNRIITAEDLEELRQTFIELGLPVPCAPCFVEDRRQLLGEIADQFISLYNGAKKIKRISDGKMVEPNKNQKKALNGLNRKGPAPTQYDLITKEGGNALRQSRPDLWNAFLAYNNARGQQSGRLHEGVAEYARQIQEWTKAQINSKNKVGGLRMFSFSDFEAAHLIDLVQIVQDAMVKGLMIQAYTKQPEFAKAARLTRIKINRSLIPLGDGLDKNGELVFDPIEGIDINDKNFVDETDNPDVGNTIIGINYKHIRACMKDVRINQIIPFHTGLKEMILKAKRIAHWENFKNYQHDKVFDAKSIVVNKDGTLSANMELVNAPEMVNIYTDVIDAAADEGKPITNPKQFQEKLFAVCKERGLIPRFWQFIDTKVDKKTGEIEFLYTPGYEKFFVDYKLFDEKGKLIPQQPVVAEWDDEFNKELLNEFVKKAKFDKEHPALSQEVMDYIEERVINGNKDAKKPKVVKRPSGRNLVYATPTPDIGRASVSRSTKDPADIIAGIVAMKTRRGEKVYINQVQKMLASVGADPALGADIIRRGQQSGEKVGNILKGKAVDDNTFIELATDESKRSRMLQFAERIGTEGYRLGAEDEKKFNALNAAKNEAALVMVENAVGFKASDMEQKYGFDLVSSVQNAKRTGARPIVGKEPDAQNKPGEINGEGIGLDEMMEAEAAAAEARKPEVVEAPESKEMAALKAKAAKRADAIDAQYGLSSGMSPAQLAAAKDAELQAEWNAAHPEDAQGGGEGVEEQPAKKVEVKRDRLDFNRASDFLAFVEEVVAKETGSDTFDSPIQVRNLANTARYFLKKIASRLMYSRDRELIMKDLDGFANIATLRGLESAVMNTYTRIQDKLIPETQEQLIHKLEWAGKQLAEQGILFSRGGDERDRKVKAKVEEWWRMVKAYLRFSPEAVQEELNRLNGIIEKRTEVAEADKAANPDSPEFLGQDLEYRRAIDLKNALTQYGGLINKTPGEIADKSEEILNQLKGSRFDLENKREDQYILTRTMSEVLKRAVVNPKAQRDRKAPNPNWLVRMFDSMMGVLEVRLRDLIRFSSGETRRKAEVAIQDIEDAIALASQTYNCYLVDNQRQIDEILTKIYGSAEKGIIRLTEDLDEEDRKRIVKQSTTDVISRSWLLQRYVELQQTDDYAQNIAVNKRDGKWREEFDKVFKKYITTDDMTFLVWMRNWYRTNLVDLNEKVLIPVSGIAQYSPGENYFPVKMKLPTREGPVTIAKAWSPLPSWLTPRVYNNYDFDEKTDLVTMWYSRMRESGSSIAYAKLGLNINDVLLNPGFKDAVEANHGEVALRRLSEHLSDIISGGASTIAESDDSIAFADRLRAWQTNLTLSCNYVSALKQMTSSPVYALRHDIDFGMVWRFMTHIDIGSVKELMASDGWKSRYGQGFSEAMQNAMRLNSSVSKGKMASAQNFLHHLYNSGFAVMEFGDSVPCVWVGQGLYRYFLAKIRDEEGGTAVMSEQDIKQRALTRTWAVIEMTQQSKRTENLTAAQRGGPLGRFLYQFVSSPVQQLAYEVQAVREALAARGTDYAKEANAHLGRVLVVNHILMPNFLYLAALVAGLPLGKVPEKDDTFWDFLMNTLMGQYGCIFLAGMVGENTLNALITGKFDYRAQGLPVMGIVDLFQKVGIGMHDLLTWNNDQFADDAIKILKSIGAPTRHAATAIENWGTAKGEKKRKKAVRSWTK